jgi:hypothetical protein
MDHFPFLSYTEVQGGGALCRYCIFFAQGKVDKGQHLKLGKLVGKPFRNWKNGIESFNEHAWHEFHLAATTRAQNFISVFENKKFDAGDIALKEHLESCIRNTTYISPKIQNEIIATCGDIIVKDITNRFTHSSFFLDLADETTMLQE